MKNIDHSKKKCHYERGGCLLTGGRRVIACAYALAVEGELPESALI
ncbi:MAG TPA: hypothetical protein VJA22_03775 [Patescibacteria group bacterium]|nr:hypothetical protein [Patescibacteria group bacterium]